MSTAPTVTAEMGAEFLLALEGLGNVPTAEGVAELLEKFVGDLLGLRICKLCGVMHSHGGAFCCDAHRSKWHREHIPAGTVKTIRKLAGGRYSVIVHFSPIEGAIAINFNIGDLVHIGAD